MNGHRIMPSRILAVHLKQTHLIWLDASWAVIEPLTKARF